MINKKQKIRLIARKVKRGLFKGEVILFYADYLRQDWVDKSLKTLIEDFDGSHNETCYEYYLQDTISATKEEAKSLIDCLKNNYDFDKFEIQMVRRLNLKKLLSK